MRANFSGESDLWHREFSDALMKLFWCTAGLPSDHPAVRYVRELDDVIAKSGAYEAWQDAVWSCS